MQNRQSRAVTTQEKVILPNTLKIKLLRFFMTNNDILRRLRYALNLKNEDMIRLFLQAGRPMTPADLDLLLKKEDEPGWIECPDPLLQSFLDGLILERRGPRDSSPGEDVLDNNTILRKIRIALEIKDTDMLAILAAGGMNVSKNELTALFRKPGHRNYMRCQDQLLKKFLKGLTVTSREELR